MQVNTLFANVMKGLVLYIERDVKSERLGKSSTSL